MGQLAILAGGGGLPPRLAAQRSDAVQIRFAGVETELTGAECHAFERMGALFEALRSKGVTEVVMAGAMSRPPLDPGAFDPVMQALAPRLVAAMQGGDDALLRLVITVFEEEGFTVRGAHEIDPSLTPAAGVLAGAPLSAAQQADVARGAEILRALSPLDVGQGCVVEAGLCLGIETLQGTDALLAFTAETPGHLRRGAGVFVKAPKTGQDLRVDLPTIGPDTLTGAAKAGLSAVVIAAGAVNLLDETRCRARASELGLSLIAAEL